MSAACTTWCTRWWTTPSTRRWPATATRSWCSILPEGGIQVTDNGRGIPVKEHPKEKIPAVTLALTVLHAGGKFGDGGYKVSGGLHGVGVSVVNALSSHLNVEVKRDGYRWTQDFSSATRTLRWSGTRRPSETGTTVTFYASPEIFETTVYSYETLAARFREMAFLNKGLTITIVDERPDRDGRRRATPITDTFRYDDGLIDYVKYLTGSKETVNPTVIAVEAERPEPRDQRRGRDAVEHLLHRVGAHLRQHDQHPRGRHPRGGLPVGADLHRQQVG